MTGLFQGNSIIRNSITDKGRIQNGQFHAQSLKKNRRTYITCYKFSGSVKLNKISREVKPEISINFYRNHGLDQILKNETWDVLSLPYPYKYKKLGSVSQSVHIYSGLCETIQSNP